MKIEVKNIKVNKAFSEETLMFQAYVFVDGVKCAFAKNDGRGGSTYCFPLEGKRGLLNQAEAFCKTLPKRKSTFGEFEMSLEDFIDDLVYLNEKNKEDEKIRKKINKLCETSIVYGNIDTSYSVISFKGNLKIEGIKMRPNGKLQLKKILEETKAKLREGDVIFNKNLDDL